MKKVLQNKAEEDEKRMAKLEEELKDARYKITENVVFESIFRFSPLTGNDIEQILKYIRNPSVCSL